MKLIGVELKYQDGGTIREIAMLPIELVLPPNEHPFRQLLITVHTSEGDLDIACLRLPDECRGANALTTFFDRQTARR